MPPRDQFTQEVADIICDRLMDGESLRRICRDKELPSAVTINKWLGIYPSFAFQYARAREAQADTLFDEILDIADTPKLGIKTVTKSTGVEITEADMIEHRRLQIDARKWAAGKMRPKKYGEMVGREPVSEGGSSPVIRVEGALPGEFGDE